MLSSTNLRKGQKYKITNYGESMIFEVMDFKGRDLKIKNSETLETLFLNELTQYGKGKDYELIDLENVPKR